LKAGYNEEFQTSLKQAIFDSDLDLAQKLQLREFVEQIDEVVDGATLTKILSTWVICPVFPVASTWHCSRPLK